MLWGSQMRAELNSLQNRPVSDDEWRSLELKAERVPLDNEAEFYKGKALPAKLRDQLAANDGAIQQARQPERQMLVGDRYALVVALPTPHLVHKVAPDWLHGMQPLAPKHLYLQRYRRISNPAKTAPTN